jgi:hypothetical protein
MYISDLLQTISSNLIILRKALGLDAFSNPARNPGPQLPTMQFQSRHSVPPLGTSWGGLEMLVVHSVGGDAEVCANATNISSTNSGTTSEQG